MVNRRMELKNFSSYTIEAKLIEQLNLSPHPEGGYFGQTFKSTHTVLPENSIHDNTQKRSASSAIYYLLSGKDFSAWHRLKSDEIWHFYKGSSLKVHVITPQGDYYFVLLGDSVVNENFYFQYVIAAGHWFAVEVMDKYSFSLVGCTVSPGYENSDFELAERAKLIALFPQHQSIIKALTRN